MTRKEINENIRTKGGKVNIPFLVECLCGLYSPTQEQEKCDCELPRYRCAKHWQELEEKSRGVSYWKEEKKEVNVEELVDKIWTLARNFGLLSEKGQLDSLDRKYEIIETLKQLTKKQK